MRAHPPGPGAVRRKTAGTPTWRIRARCGCCTGYCSPRSSARLPVWWLAFNEFNAVEFAEADLQAAICTLLDGVPEWPKPHPNSINKDISTLLRICAPAERTGGPASTTCWTARCGN